MSDAEQINSLLMIGLLYLNLQQRDTVWFTQAFLLVITHEYKTIHDRDVFLSLFEPLAKYVVQHEPETLGYEVAISDKTPLKILIFERYALPSLLSQTNTSTFSR